MISFFQRWLEMHPIHPMIVHFPIALTGAAFLFILLAAWRKNPLLEYATYVNTALAAVSTIFAGATGIYDNYLNYEGQAPNANWKIALAIALFLLTTLTAFVRYKRPDLFSTFKGPYIALCGLNFAIALVLAFLGGVILYGF